MKYRKAKGPPDETEADAGLKKFLAGAAVLKKTAVNVEREDLSRPLTEIIRHPLNPAFLTPSGPKLNPLNSPVETVGSGLCANS